MTLVELNGMHYFVSPNLVNLWEKNSLANLKKNNSDRVYIIDGMERTGKSLFAIQQAGYLDKDMFRDIPTFLSRICFTPDEFFDRVRDVKNGVIIFDEAFRGFSSRAVLSRTNKKLVTALMEMGQNNNIVFIVLPSFFLLDIYPAMFRSHGLFNITFDKSKTRRIWRGYNKFAKNTLYQQGGRKGWSYCVPTLFRGNFWGKFPAGKIYEQAYLRKKQQALIEIDKATDKSETLLRAIKQRDILLYYIRKKIKNFSYDDLSLWFKEYNVDASPEYLAAILRNFTRDSTSNSIKALEDDLRLFNKYGKEEEILT